MIEDDYDSEFRYKGKPIPALQGMDQRGRVIYMGTFSKSIAPAIRVGFMVLPEQLLAAYREKAGFYLSTVSRIDQTVLCQFLTEGYYERHLNRMRAGLHVLLTLKKGMAEEKLISLAADRGIRVYGLSDCLIGKPEKQFESTVMLGYASLSESDIQEGTRGLIEAWS